MMDNIKWNLFGNNERVYLSVDQRIPLIIAASLVGRQFDQIVEFSFPNIVIDKAAVIVGAESEVNGTTFQLSFPLSDRSSGSTQNVSSLAGEDQC
jgi:hypothetical protein